LNTFPSLSPINVSRPPEPSMPPLRSPELVKVKESLADPPARFSISRN